EPFGADLRAHQVEGSAGGDRSAIGWGAGGAAIEQAEVTAVDESDAAVSVGGAQAEFAEAGFGEPGVIAAVGDDGGDPEESVAGDVEGALGTAEREVA